MSLDDLISSWDFAKPKDLKIKVDIFSQHRFFNQINSVFEIYSKNYEDFIFSADYTQLNFKFNCGEDSLEFCGIIGSENNYFLKFHNVKSKLIFEQIMYSYYSNELKTNN